MKLYRYTSNKEGIWAAGKRLLPQDLVDEAWEARKWMPKPELPEGEYHFYLTKQGKEKYEQTLLHVHKKYLTNIEHEEVGASTIGKPVYQDEWQVIVAK